MVFFPFPFPRPLEPGDFCLGDFLCDFGDLCLIMSSAPTEGAAMASSGGTLKKLYFLISNHLKRYLVWFNDKNIL